MSEPLSVVIVNYRTPDLTIKCVRSLLTQGIAAPEDIIVVENASGDGSRRVIDAAQLGCMLIQADCNRGYGAGLNLGMAQARHALVLCLNPDTYFENADVLGVGVAFDANSRLGLLGLDLRDPDGSRQFSARRDYSLIDIILRRSWLGRFGPGYRLVQRHLMTDSWGGGIFSSDWVLGTGFVVRRAAFAAINGMDIRFFLYMEDVDLCVRLRQAGWRVAATPAIQLTHDHQRASGQRLLSRAAWLHLKSLSRFIRQHSLPLLPRRLP